MPACPSCGRENPRDARFCSACGAPLAAPIAEREQRKVVTVLFCDLVGSTALGESTDPEALRARMRRYFEDLRAILERHGGTVEKFVGDAVMAVFGIPVSHEDDALRAVRAASEMRVAIAAHRLEARIGVNTGEVVVGGEGETLVTGDAVNVAARLEQAAASGEVLIGAETRLLVRDAIRVEPVEQLALKGKSEPLEAFRLLELLAGAVPVVGHLDTPLVGRERERRRLWRDYEDAVADRTCRLFTLLGPAGIGKSRLVADFLERVGDSADVLRGRCLSYGEGITYWPLVEMLLAIDVEPDQIIGTSPPETRLGFRRLLETRASERPQVVIVEDLQWAEPVFLDLVEHVADFSREAPTFLLCIARTELLDVRPEWGGGKLNATSLLLEPLSEHECSELMDRLVEGSPLGDGLRTRITESAAGNPLFVEEMLAMVRERGVDGDIAVPPTIHALLQARIDSLDGEVRTVMERGAVEGEVFHRSAVIELAPDPLRPAIETHLATLVRKELIRSTTPTFAEDEAFRFRHLLIRDAAYESLPKATRAELHERFAEWLSTHDLVERDEIVGYHLEQAHRYRAELDPADSALPALAARAAEYLAAAGRGALDRGDNNAGRSLLRRAAAVLPTGDERRLSLAPDLCFALWGSGRFEEAQEVLAEASTASDPVVSAIAAILETGLENLERHGVTLEAKQARRERARVILEEASDEEGLSLYWWSLGQDAFFRCRAAECMEAAERSIAHAEAAGIARLVWKSAGLVRGCLVWGSMPVGEAIERAMDPRLSSFGQVGEAAVSLRIGLLTAMRGDVGGGRALVQGARRTLRDAGLFMVAEGGSMYEADIAWRAGDTETWEHLLRDGLGRLRELGAHTHAATVALNLADCLFVRGRLSEIDSLCSWARDRTDADDVVNAVFLGGLEGLVLAGRGHLDDAERSARRAVELGDTTDFFDSRAWPRIVLAETLAFGGRMDEAAELGAQALAIHEAKGDVTGKAQRRERLAVLGIAVD